MYISKIRVENFRCFEDVTVEFSDGLNVIIGENNSGKTTLFKALQLIFNRSQSRRFTVDDFFKGKSSKSDAPKDEPLEITVTITLQSSDSDSIEDKAVVASWLTKLESPWEATLTYKYFLPEKDRNAFIARIKEEERKPDYWGVLNDFLPKYVFRIYGGNPDSKNRAETEFLEKFECEILDAIRDVESKMFTGQNVLLKQVLNHFLDHGIKISDKTGDMKDTEIKEKKRNFRKQAEELVESLKSRIETQNILTLADKTGAMIGGKPGIGGRLEEKEVISVLKLVIESSDNNPEIPVTYNGLGYNNLIYIALILSKLNMDTSDHFGENAKLFPFLLIEEPESHLHPAMQYNLLKFLRKAIRQKADNENDDGKISRQIFVTTHSTHIASAVPLDSIICMVSKYGKIGARYPGKVFSGEKKDVKSKKYIERFLDATKSTLLFSKGIIFVEGLAEKILIPCFAEYVKCPLEEKHVTTVQVGGSTYKHFIKLFGAGISEERRKYALPHRVSCMIDNDPKRRKKNENNSRWKSCWPFQLGVEEESYEYTTFGELESSQIDADNVKVFQYSPIVGKTFEYDVAYENAGGKEIFWLPENFDSNLDEETTNALKLFKFSNKTEEEKAKFAASYLLSIESKGENAFNLERRLRENLEYSDDKSVFNVPSHVKNAIEWACYENEEVNDEAD